MTPSDRDNQSEMPSIRDTVESIWVAILLAFVLRAFMVEAFVIPTGSMAPRLLGEHRDLRCPSCGYDYAFGLADERRGNSRVSRDERHAVIGARCPNCGLPYPGKAYINSGDRVLVLKCLYRFREPRPWDVIVFKNPQDNRQNYIKRLIGLPGETIEIVHGDIFVRKDPKHGGDGEWHIRRKPVRAQESMWQVIFDNDYRPDPQIIARHNRDARGASEQAQPPRWRPADEKSRQWGLDDLNGRRFAFHGGPDARLVFHAGPRSFLPTYGYNTWKGEENQMDTARDICGDLRLSVLFVPKGPKSRLTLSLVSMDKRFEGTISADGTVALRGRSDDASMPPWDLTGKVPAPSPTEGSTVALVHVDFRAELWIAGRRVLASTDTEYLDDHDALKERVDQAKIPLPKLAIAAEGDPSDLYHVRVERDVFYTCPRLARTLLPELWEGPLGDHSRKLRVDLEGRGWGTTGRPIELRKYPADQRDLDEFFVLGDNSPQSLDGRGWVAAAPTLRLTDKNNKPLYRLGTVPRYQMIGKALFVYWPAGFRLPGLPGLPIIPNVGRMRLIR